MPHKVGNAFKLVINNFLTDEVFYIPRGSQVGRPRVISSVEVVLWAAPHIARAWSTFFLSFLSFILSFFFLSYSEPSLDDDHRPLLSHPSVTQFLARTPHSQCLNNRWNNRIVV